jgi:hypothetical protein
MDAIAKSVLQYIQQQKSHAVIAGGAARDEYLSLIPRDYDIWVQGKYDFMGLISEYDVKDFRQKGTSYDKAFHDNGIREVFSFSVEGRSFDVMTYKDKYFEEDEFGKKVVEKFDFGLNMVYYDGVSIDDTNRNFRDDMDISTMSLINLESMEHLPTAIRRFEKFNQKFSVQQNAPENSWAFRAPCLKLLTEKKEEYKPFGRKKLYWTAEPALGEWIGEIATPPVPPMPAVQAFDWDTPEAEIEDNF